VGKHQKAEVEVIMSFDVREDLSKDRKESKRVRVKEKGESWEPVAHTYNPSYLGCRDQEECSLKPVPGK
jgi:hypothetical protein